MRTKAVEGVLRLDVCRLDVKPELVVVYDGLVGITSRPVLRDLLDELGRKGAGTLNDFIAAVRVRGAARIYVYFCDYVSYGIGGGDATAEFYFGSYDLLYYGPNHPPYEEGNPEELTLLRHNHVERILLDGAPA